MPAINLPVGETEARASLLQFLGHRLTLGQGWSVREEVKIGCSRIDVLALFDELEGFEIKSDFDSLKRLPGQVASYSRTLDRVTLVVGHEHLADARHQIPKWWGLLLASKAPSGRVHMQQVRDATKNPNEYKLGMAQLLWRHELVDALRGLTGLEPPSSADTCRLRTVLTAKTDAPALRAVVLRCLRNGARREQWRDTKSIRPSSAARLGRRLN